MEEPPIMNQRRPWLSGIVDVAAIWAGSMFALSAISVHGEAQFGLLALFAVVILLRRSIHMVRRTRLLRFARNHQHLLCTHCGYPLQPLGVTTKCPECGAVLEVDATRQMWRIADRKYLGGHG